MADALFIIPPLSESGAPPTVTWVSPTESGTLASRAEPIDIRISDDSLGFPTVVVMAEFTNGAYEVVHDGDRFAPLYATDSTRTVPGVTGTKYDFHLVRNGGWPTDVTMKVVAIDAVGNVG